MVKIQAQLLYAICAIKVLCDSKGASYFSCVASAAYFLFTVKTMSKELGIRLYYLRTHKDLTQTKVAEMLGLERSTYSKYESGRTEPNLRTIKELARIFKVEYGALVDPVLSDEEIADYQHFRSTHKGEKHG